MNSAHVKLTLTGSLDHLRIVWQTGEALLEAVPFAGDPEGTRYNFLVSLQEIVTNVLRHGYRGEEGLPVEVSFTISGQSAVVEVRDRGPAFDPLEFDVASLMGEPSEDDAMPETAGGYGIMIARTVMDRVEYSRDGDWNVLSMEKLADSTALVPNS